MVAACRYHMTIILPRNSYLCTAPALVELISNLCMSDNVSIDHINMEQFGMERVSPPMSLCGS